MADLEGDYRALTKAAGAVWLPRDVVRVSGPQAETFLQGQVSQDVTAITDGGAAWSFVLQPHGKVDAFVRIVRVAEGDYRLVVDAGYGTALIERLRRFLLRVDAEVAPSEAQVLAVRGPDAKPPSVPDGATVLDADWPGMDGFDVVGEHIVLPDDVAVCDPAAYEVLRVEAGFPRMGAELDERTIPAEAGVNDRSVSFRKGCYTGQELMARINSRGGNVPRHLRAVLVPGDDLPPAGARILAAQRPAASKPLGMLSSVVHSPARGIVGLAMVRRDVVPPADAVVECHDGPVPCRILTLPLA